MSTTVKHPPGNGTTTSPCRHWIGAEGRECGSQVGVRAFIQGPRCPIHDPNVFTGGQP
ncbi:hypothetical protein [Micromonospora sp. NPDC023644]|uniref:hypothetical protein n=1 Tax=Micromonospora sp. NPDC023644 TaxID=3154321 RepID=UPI0033FCC66D